MNETPTTTSKDPEKRKPEGEDINWLSNQIGWPFPTWVDGDLYRGEFKKDTVEATANLLIEMFNNLGQKIDKALVTDAGDVRQIKFKYWRHLSDKATKMKPTTLKATLYKHPDYDKVWMLVEAA
jgi:hypothetical protein